MNMFQDKKEATSTLLLLCGDHGMSDQGSHGGSSSSETAVPLIFISSRYSAGKGEHLSHCQTWGGGSLEAEVRALTLDTLVLQMNFFEWVLPYIISYI